MGMLWVYFLAGLKPFVREMVVSYVYPVRNVREIHSTRPIIYLRTLWLNRKESKRKSHF